MSSHHEVCCIKNLLKEPLFSGCRFKSHIRCQSVLELVSEEELKDLMKLLPTEDIKMESEPCVKEEDKTNSFAQSSEDLENENETKEKVEESNFEDENTVKSEPEVKTEISEKSKLPSRLSEEAEEKMKMIVLERRTEAYGKLKKEIEKIMPFEEQVSEKKRPLSFYALVFRR